MMSISDMLAKFIKNLQEFLSIPEKFSKIIVSPISIITMIGLLVLFIVLFKARKIKFDSKTIARVGLALALASILQCFKIYKFPQGGSVTLGSFIPILLIGFMYGPELGLFTGFIYGIINLLLDPYILTPVQVLFDYPLPFMCLGLTGFFRMKNGNGKVSGFLNKYRNRFFDANILIGAFVAIFFKYLCHFISGVAFFAEYAGDMNPWLYSFIVNGSIGGAECLICLVILSILPVQRLMKEINRYN